MAIITQKKIQLLEFPSRDRERFYLLISASLVLRPKFSKEADVFFMASSLNEMKQKALSTEYGI